MIHKQIILLRHGEAEHNKNLFKIFSLDPQLNFNGMRQARAVNIMPNDVDIVLVSPLTRTLQTATLIFNAEYRKKYFEETGNVLQIVALDELRENNLIYKCNWRKNKRDLERLFPNINFSLISEQDTFEDLGKIVRLLNIINYLPFKKFVFVTHKNITIDLFARANVKLFTIEHCKPYILNL